MAAAAVIKLAPDLAANDFNRLDDIFVRDLQEKQTALVSVNRVGTTSANGRSLSADISSDGRVITFDSDAPDIAIADENNEPDVFAFDLSAVPAPRIIEASYLPNGLLIVLGEVFDRGTRLFIDDREVTTRFKFPTKFLVRMTLTPGAHEVRVVNSDGQADSKALVVR